MEIRDTFRVSTPIEETWLVLLDVERIAPCLPGAQLREVEGDEYRGVVKVKVGPIVSQYKGTARLAEVDESERRIVIDAKGRDTRGAGDAHAVVTVAMREDGTGTIVDVATDLRITGRVATMGRGMIEEVSAKILGQFVENLERDVIGGTAEGAASPTAAVEIAESGDSEQTISSPPTAPAVPTVRHIEAPEAEPIDLLAAAGRPVMRRLVPVGTALLVMLVLWRLLRRRG